MKSWHMPQLIVLARSKPEEAVLIACKSGQAPSSGLLTNGSPQSVQLHCVGSISTVGIASCPNCDTIALS